MIPSPPSLPYLDDCAGLFVGGCVERGVGSRFRSQAHAHTSGPHKGWICILAQRRIWTATGNPGRVWMHEIAHVLTGHGHDDVWRAKMRDLGQPLPKQYRKATESTRQRNTSYFRRIAGREFMTAPHGRREWMVSERIGRSWVEVGIAGSLREVESLVHAKGAA